MPKSKIKKFLVKILDPTGQTFLETIPSNELASDPNFSTVINGGCGQCRLLVSRPYDDFGENIDHMNIVEVYQSDAKNPSGRLIYRGFIASYEPFWSNSGEGVNIVCLGVGSLLQFAYYKDGASFDVSEVATDPKDVFISILDHFQSIYSGQLVDYTQSTLDAVGTNIDITFSKRKWLECMKDCVRLGDPNWYFRIDCDGFVYLREKESTATHTFTLGKHVNSFTSRKSSETSLNDVTVERSGGGTDIFSDAASEAEFGKRELYLVDSQIDNSGSGLQRATKLVEDNKGQKINAAIEINSNFDIESIKVGHTCQIRNFKAPTGGDVPPFLDNLQILKIDYKVDTAELELEDLRLDFGLELQKQLEGR